MWSMALLNVRCGKKLFCLNSCLSNLNVSHSSETTKNYLLPPCLFSLVFHYNELYFFSLYVCLCAKFCAPAPDPPAPAERLERYLKLTTDDKYYSLTGGNTVRTKVMTVYFLQGTNCGKQVFLCLLQNEISMCDPNVCETNCCGSQLSSVGAIKTTADPDEQSNKQMAPKAPMQLFTAFSVFHASPTSGIRFEIHPNAAARQRVKTKENQINHAVKI